MSANATVSPKLTVLEVVRRTTAFFEERGVRDARVDAEWIISNCLGLRRLDLYLQFDRTLTESELASLREPVRRRGAREPLQYILGFTEFADLRLVCDSRALIPRPETEKLYEILAKVMEADPPARILDLGTGTGALALALSKRFPKASVTATDRSAEALDLAKENALNNDLCGSVSFVLHDWFEGVEEGPLDLIVSNPPYLSREEWMACEPEVRDHEPEGALVAREKGTSELFVIIDEALPHLAPGGLLALETGTDHHDLLEEHASSAGYGKTDSLHDLSGRRRFFLARSPNA